MSSVYIAQGLDSLLKTWEDRNLTSEAFFYVTKLFGSMAGTGNSFIPLAGSEINRNGKLAKAIPNYKLFRDFLGGLSVSHETDFLPQIPKARRDEYSSAKEFCNSTPVTPLILIPIFLTKWLENKKVYLIEDTVPIPLVDLRSENWLGNIPCHSFYLRISSPIVFEFRENSKIQDKPRLVQDILVYEDTDSTNVFAWAVEDNGTHLTPKEKENFETAIKKLRKPTEKGLSQAFNLIAKKLNVRDPGFFFSFRIKKGTTQVKTNDGIASVKYIDFYEALAHSASKPTSSDYSEDDREEIRMATLQSKIIMELVNGFCKLLSQLPKGNTLVSIDSSSIDPLPKLDKKWYELNAQTIDHLETESKDDLIVIKRSAGAEKSPHIRRGHFRRIVQSDGTVKDIWVAQATIRKDKLETEQLQGGALRIK